MKIFSVAIIIIMILGVGCLAYFFISESGLGKSIEVKTARVGEMTENILHYFKAAPTELATQEASSTEKISTESIRVPILVYHSVEPIRQNESEFVKSFDTEPQIFEKQMQYIKDNNYAVISFDDLYNALTSGKKLPEKSVVLSFDDGWQNQYLNAFPVLKKFNYSATFFIFTSAPGHEHFMTWDEIKELESSGMAIGSHTLNHLYLKKITDPKELDKQIVYGKKSLENHLGHSVDLFAYPFGQYDDQIIEVVKTAGFKLARSIYNGRYHTKGDLYTLKAILMNSDYNRFVRELEKMK